MKPTLLTGVKIEGGRRRGERGRGEGPKRKERSRGDCGTGGKGERGCGGARDVGWERVRAKILGAVKQRGRGGGKEEPERDEEKG